MATRHIKRGRLRGKPIECNSFVLPYRLTWCVPSLNGRFIELRQFDKKKKRQSSAYHSTLNENLIDDFINLKKAPESGTSKEVRKCLRIDLADVIHGKHIRFEDHENDGEKLIEYRFFDEKCDSLMLFYSKQDDKTVWLTTARLNFPKAGIEVDRDRAIKIDDLTGSKLRGRIFWDATLSRGVLIVNSTNEDRSSNVVFVLSFDNEGKLRIDCKKKDENGILGLKFEPTHLPTVAGLVVITRLPHGDIRLVFIDWKDGALQVIKTFSNGNPANNRRFGRIRKQMILLHRSLFCLQTSNSSEPKLLLLPFGGNPKGLEFLLRSHAHVFNNCHGFVFGYDGFMTLVNTRHNFDYAEVRTYVKVYRIPFIGPDKLQNLSLFAAGRNHSCDNASNFPLVLRSLCLAPEYKPPKPTKPEKKTDESKDDSWSLIRDMVFTLPSCSNFSL